MPLKQHPTDPDKMVYVSPHYDLPYTPTASPVATPRPWVGLTDSEYQEILKQHEGAGLIAFYNLVEAKLKKKNS